MTVCLPSSPSSSPCPSVTEPEPPKKKCKQLKIPVVKTTQEEEKKLNLSIVRMLLAGNCPFALVENKAFQSMIQVSKPLLPETCAGNWRQRMFWVG